MPLQVQGNLQLHPETEAADDELERVSNVLSKDAGWAQPVTAVTSPRMVKSWI